MSDRYAVRAWTERAQIEMTQYEIDRAIRREIEDLARRYYSLHGTGGVEVDPLVELNDREAQDGEQ